MLNIVQHKTVNYISFAGFPFYMVWGKIYLSCWFFVSEMSQTYKTERKPSSFNKIFDILKLLFTNFLSRHLIYIALIKNLANHFYCTFKLLAWKLKYVLIYTLHLSGSDSSQWFWVTDSSREKFEPAGAEDTRSTSILLFCVWTDSHR